MRAGKWPAPFVLLTGGKGGVGKTMTAANLGVHLARTGRRVLLIDLDLGLANLNVVLNITPDVTVEDALAGRCDWADCVVEGPGGVHVLPAGSGTAAMGRHDEGRLRRLLAGVAELAPDYDLLIGDSAAGIGPDVLSSASAADLVVVVTTPEPAALTDAYGLLKALDTHSQNSGVEVPTPELFVNLAGGLEEAEATAAKLRGICERFLARSPRMAGWLPRTKTVQAACREQLPFATGEREPGDGRGPGNPRDRLIPARAPKRGSAAGGPRPGNDRNSLVQHCLRRLAGRVERRLSPAVTSGAALLKGS